MLAITLHGPNDLRVERVRKPDLPEGGLIVRICSVGICGSDVRNWRHGSHRLAGPQVVGHEMAGVVDGSDAPEYPIGTAVAVCPGIPCLRCGLCQRGYANLCPNRTVFGYDIPGGMAEFLAIPADAISAGNVVRVPESLPVEFAALAEPLHTVLNGQDRARIGPQDSVLVLGLGPIGVLHMASAKSRGASPVLGLDLNQGRVRSAGEILGGEQTLPIEEGWESRVLAMTDSQGWDVVIVANSAATSLSTAIRLAGPAARVLAFAGVALGTPVVDLDLNRVHYRQLEITGSFAGTPRYYQKAVRWLSDQDLPLQALVTAQLPLSRAVEGYEMVERGDGFKTMLRAS